MVRDEECRVADDVALGTTDFPRWGADDGLATALSEWLNFRFFSVRDTKFSELCNTSSHVKRGLLAPWAVDHTGLLCSAGPGVQAANSPLGPR